MNPVQTNKILDAFIKTYQQRVNNQLHRCLPDKNQTPTRLHEAMHYAVMNGGKRIRPLLTYATGFYFDADLSKIDACAVAIELIHAYSLVHDDLPAMDNDDFRRGQPSCHKAFDESTAILVGDALQSLAFETLARENNARLIAVLARACGSLGMAGGQQLDLESKNKPISKDQMEIIHHLKTGALFCASVELGAIAADCTDEKLLNRFLELGTHVGLIFQWQDDLLDETVTDKKSTINRIDQLFQKTQKLLAGLEGKTEVLHEVINSLRNRSGLGFEGPGIP